MCRFRPYVYFYHITDSHLLIQWHNLYPHYWHDIMMYLWRHDVSITSALVPSICKSFVVLVPEESANENRRVRSIAYSGRVKKLNYVITLCLINWLHVVLKSSLKTIREANLCVIYMLCRDMKNLPSNISCNSWMVWIRRWNCFLRSSS